MKKSTEKDTWTTSEVGDLIAEIAKRHEDADYVAHEAFKDAWLRKQGN